MLRGINMPIVPQYETEDLELGIENKQTNETEILIRGKHDTGELILADTLSIDRKSNVLQAKSGLEIKFSDSKSFNFSDVCSKAIDAESALQATSAAVRQTQAVIFQQIAEMNIMLTRLNTAVSEKLSPLETKVDQLLKVPDWRKSFGAQREFQPKIKAQGVKLRSSSCRYQTTGCRTDVYASLTFDISAGDTEVTFAIDNPEPDGSFIDGSISVEADRTLLLPKPYFLFRSKITTVDFFLEKQQYTLGYTANIHWAYSHEITR